MKRLGLALAAIATVGAIVFVGGRTKAAAGGSTPKNITQVDGRLGALALGANVIAGGTWIIVGVDEAHRADVEAVVARRAAAHPAWQYAIIDLQVARELAADRADVTIPAAIWGGVAAVRDGELVTHVFFPSADSIADAEGRIDHVEAMAPSLGAPMTPSIAAGLLVPVEVGSGPIPPSLPPASPRGRWGLRRRVLRR